jgi:hypothetical protein
MSNVLPPSKFSAMRRKLRKVVQHGMSNWLAGFFFVVKKDSAKMREKPMKKWQIFRCNTHNTIMHQ